MMSDLFRREAVEHKQQKLYGDVVLTMPVTGWAVTGAIVGAFVLVVCVLVFGSYARKETMGGWIRPDGGVIRVRAMDEGVVEAVHVAEGSRVEAGAQLVSLRLGDGLAAGEGLAQRLSGELRNERHQLQLQLDATQARFAAQSLRLRDEAAGLGAEIVQYRRQLALLERRTALAQKQFNEQADLVKQGFVSKRDSYRLEDALLEQTESKEGVLRGILAKEARQKSVLHELAALAPERAAALGAISERMAALDQRLVEVHRRARVVLAAPVSGRVAFVRVALGEAAAPGSILVDLLPEEGPLRAELFAPSRATGFLRPGSLVQLRYDAYPYQKFGVARGRVMQISRTTADPRELPRVFARGDDPLYRVMVELDRDHLVIDGARQPLLAGMTLKADVVLERRSVGEYLFEPLVGLVKRD